MSTGEPAGEGGGGGGDSTPCGDHSASTPGIGLQTGIQHPPPSPLSGCYLLVVLPEPHTAQHRDLIVNRLAKGFLSWDKDSCHVDLEKELQALVAQAPEGEEARNGERLIQYATENLVTEVLIHPQTNTLLQCIRNLLASFTKHRHIIHAGYTFSGNGSWILQDGTFSLADFLDAFSEHEVQRVIRAYENSVTVDIHCAGVGDWTSSRLSKEACARSCRVRVNPDDVLTAGVPAISSFTEYLGQYLVAQTLDQLMEPSDVVGNIRFSHPTLYVFPGGQGDAALFGINGFNMLVDGGFARKACFWDFARHLDRLDAVLLTRVNNSNIGGMSSVLRKKQEMHVYPQIGHFFCNLVERRGANSPDGDKDVDPLILNLTDLGQEMMVNLRHINLRAHPCYRDLDPINLYHKVGHGTLDMYVLSPSKDTREVREFLTKWQTSDSKLFAGSHKKDSNHLTFPIQNLVSICALLVWQPANPDDTITRILFPGSTPQNKIFEGLERLKHLEFMKHPICSAKSLSPSTSLTALKEKSNKQKTSIMEKSIDKDKDIKRVSEYRKEKKETLDTKTVKGVEESSPKPAAVPSAPIIPTTKQPAKVDVKAKKVVENKKIEKETKTDSKKIEKDLKEVKKDIVKREVVKIDKQDVETKKTDVVKTEIEKTAINKESKPKPEPKRKEIKTETRTVVKTKVEAQPKAAPKPSVDKKLKPSIDKKDVKSSPTTPKKIINGTASRTEITKTSTKTTMKTSSSRTVSAMPAKSAKDATNRKVVESKNLTTSSTPAAAHPAPKAPSVTAKPRSTDRKPISRRPKTGSPSKPRLSGSPAKSTRSTPPAPPKTEKDSVIRRPKVDKPPTSTPSAVEIESVVKLVDKSLTEKSDDISIDSIESKVLADLKEEREVVEEIEAVLSKAERNEVVRKDDQLEGDDEITAEATDKKEDDVTEEDVTAEIEDVPKKVGSRKESQEFTEEDEYLIVEKEEIYTEDSALSGEGEQKHLLDEVESEKAKKYEVSKDLDVPEEDEEPKEKDEMEEKEKEEKRERKIQFHDKPEVGEITMTRKEQLEEEVKDIIASATEMIQKTDERDDSGKKDSEDITKEPSSLSPDKFDSSEKKTDTDLKPEVDQKEVPEKLEESQDRISTLESGATTTAPTLPEDERITLDEIKEDVDEKHVKEEVKEKEIPQPVKDKLPEVPLPVPTAMMKPFVIRETVSTVQRDIVKTPDEVADLPVHEEVDPKLYDMDDYDKVKDEKVPQTPEAKEPPTPPVKEQKGMFSFFGKVADKFEKGMDKLTGKSKKDADKEADEKSSKSSSPKETKTGFEDVDMGKVFAKVGKIEPHTADTFEKAKPQTPADIKVAAIKETAAFLQQEIKETRIDSVEPVVSEPKKPVEEINVLKDVAQKLDTAIEKPLDLTSKKEEILSEELVEDTKEVEALLEEASKKFVTVKDSLRDSLESLEDKIEDIVDDMRPIDAKDAIKSTLTGVAERLEDLKPQFDDTADSKDTNKVTFEIPKDGEEEGEEDSDEYSGPVRDFKEAVRDVGEVLAGTAGIVIDDKPKDVIEIVKKVAEVLKEDNFLLPTPKDDEKPKPEEPSRPKPIMEEIMMPKRVGITEELPPQEEIEEMLEGGIARTLPAYEKAGGIEVEEELCVKVIKDPKVDIKSPIKETAPFGDDLKHLCSDLIDVKKPAATPKPKLDDHKGKVDVMEAGIEEVCTKKEVKREQADEDEEELEQSEILFQQKLAPTQAELVMVTPDSVPTSPKFSADKVYDKELEDDVAGVSKVPGVPKEIEEFISSKADVYDIIDEVIKKGRKITIEIIEYIVVVKKVSREHVIYIIEEIIINKGISPESVIEDVEILKSQESTNDLLISSVKRVEIEEYIVAEYIMKGKRITILTIEEIAIKKVVPKRIVIEIIEEIIIKRKISRESVYQMTEEEFVKEVKPIYDEFERSPRRESQVTVDEPIVEAEKPILEALSAGIIPAKAEEKSPKSDKPKSPVESQVPEPSKEKEAPIFDEKDLDEGKLIDDFVNISSKDAVMNFLHEERRLSHEEYNQAKQDSKPDSKIPVTDDIVKDLGDDFEAVEQEYKVHDVPTTTASTVHLVTDLKDKDDVVEAVEDDLDDVIEAAEKFVEETKEKLETLKETLFPSVLADKMPEKVTSEILAEVEDDKVPLKLSDKVIVDTASVVVSEMSISTEKYLDEDKEKTTTVASESPKQSKDTKDILDDIEHAIKDSAALVSDEIRDIKDAVAKLDKPEPETYTKDDHLKEPSTDKPDVGDKVEEKEAPHVTDVPIKSPLDDKGDHPQLTPDVKTVTEKIDEPVKELKEKETAVSDAVADKVPEKDSVKPETESVPEVMDDKHQPETDKVIEDAIILSGVTIATEKYLDEDKEKVTTIASESPKQPEEKPKVIDGIKDVTHVVDELHEIHDVKDTSPKLEKPESKPEEKKGVPEETPVDKHEVDAKVGEKVSEKVEEDKLPVKDEDSKSGTKSPSIGDRESPVSKEDELPASKRLEIEQYIIDEFITKKRKITSQIIEEIVIKKSVSRYIIIEIIEEIIIKLKIRRESVIDVADIDEPKDDYTDVKDKHSVPETPEDKPAVGEDMKPEEGVLDSKRSSIAGKTSPVHDVQDVVHEEKGHVTDVTIRAPLDDKGRHPELTVDIESKISPERDTITDGIHETGDKVDKENHNVPDLSHDKQDVKDAAPKSDPPKPKTDEKEDHPKEAFPDKHDVDTKVEEEEPLHKEKAHMTDVTIRAPRDDAGHHPELKIDIETTGHKAHEPEETAEERDHIEAEDIVEPQPETGKEDSKEIFQTPEVADKTSQPEQLDKKTPEPTEIKKSPSKDSLMDAAEKLPGDVKEKVEEVTVEDTVSKVTDVKILDTSEIVDLKQSEIKVDEEKDDKETDKISKETVPAPSSHDAEPTIPDSSCFDIGKLESHPAPTKTSPLDVHDTSDEELDKLPKHPDVHRKDTELDDAETELAEHSIRKKRSLGEDVIEPEKLDEEPKDTVRKSLDLTPSVTEKSQTSPKDLAPSSVEPDDDDDKEVGTVRRMVVTASSEDGGHEIELCPTGSITFGKSVTPDDSLKDISTKSTPDKDSLQLEKDSLYSGKSSPEKDSISEKSASDLKDDKGTPEDSLEKSITGVHSHVVGDDDGRKSQVDEPKETKPAVLDEVASKTPKDTSHELGDEKVSKKPKKEAPAKPAETTPTVPEKLEDKVPEKPEEKVTEKVPEKPTDIPGLKSPETAPSEDISPAETVFDKSPTDKHVDTLSKEPTDSHSRSPSLPSEKLDHVAPGDQFEHPPIVPTCIVPEEHDASRKSSIASVKPDEEDTSVDKDHKAESTSPIKESSIVTGKLDDKVSPVEAKKDKSPSPISGKTTDKPDEMSPKEKSPSPEMREEKEMPKTPNVTPEDDKHSLPADKLEEEKSPSHTADKLAEEKIPTDKSLTEVSPLPTFDKDSDKPTSPSPITDKVLDQSRTPSIAPEKLDDKDATEDKVYKDKSPSPISDDKIDTAVSITSVKHDEVHISAEIVQKDETPSPVEPADKSRKPSIVSEKLSDKDAPKDEDIIVGADKSRSPSIASEEPGLEDVHELTTQKDKSPSPTADEKIDKSRTPSITPEKLTGMVELDDQVHKDKSPSPTPSLTSDKPGEKEVHELKDHKEKPDRSRTSSITSEKPEEEITPHGEVQKERSPSSVTDDTSRKPSIVADKPEAKNIPDSTVQKDKSPSPAVEEVPDKSRTPSIVADKPGTTDIADSTVQKDKSPSPAVEEVPDKSRTPSIVADKPGTTDIADSTVQKDKSPSPAVEEVPDKSRTPSIVADKPGTTDIADSTVQKDKSPSPAVEEVPDKSRTPSIVADKPGTTDIPDSTVQKDKSPSPAVEEVPDKSRTPSIVADKPGTTDIADSTVQKDKSPSPAVEEVPDKSRTPSIVADKPGTTDIADSTVQKDKSPSPAVEEVPDKSRTPSIVADKPGTTDIADSTVQKDKSPSPAVEEVPDKSRTPSIVADKPGTTDIPDSTVQKDKSPSPAVEEVPDKSRTPSIVADKPGTTDIADSTVQKDKSPSPAVEEVPDKSRTPSIVADKPGTTDIADSTVQKDKSPSPAVEEVPDKSRTPSIVADKPGTTDIADSTVQKDKSPSPAVEEVPDKSRTPSIVADKPGTTDIPDSTVQKDKSPSPAVEEVPDKSRTPSIVADKPGTTDIADSPVQKDKSPSPAVEEVPDKSRKPSIVSDKLTEHLVPDDKVLGDKSPSPITDETTDKSRSPSVTLDKPHLKDIKESTPMVSDVKEVAESIELKDKTPSPHVLPDDKAPSSTPSQVGDKSRTPSIVSEDHDEKDVIHKDGLSSPATEKETEEKQKPSMTPDVLETSSLKPEDADKSRKPSITSDKVDEKDVTHGTRESQKPGTVPDGEIKKDRSPSPTVDEVTDKSRSPSMTSGIPDDKIPEAKEQKDKPLSPTGDDKLDRHSRTSSISSVKLDDKDIPDDKLHKERSPSPASDKVIDKSRSAGVASEKPEEKVPESKSPMIDEKTDRHSRTSSISSVKLDDKNVPDAKLHKKRSPSPAADEVSDKSRSSSVTSEVPDDKIPEAKEQKDKPLSPMADDKLDRHSRTSSISSVKLDDKDVLDDKLHKERSPSPASDKLTDKSRSPSVASEKPEEKIPESKSPMIDEKTDLRSRTSSISSVKSDDKDVLDDKLHKERSPSPASDKATDKSRSPSVASEKPDEKIPESKSPMIDEKTDLHSRTSSISSVKLDKDVPDDKLHKDRSPSPASDKATDKSRSPSVASEKPDEKIPESKSPMIDEKTDLHSRTSSISSVKLDKDVPDDKLHKDRSPSPASDKATDKSRSPSAASEKPDEKIPESKSPMIDEKTDLRSRTSSISSVKIDDKDIPDDKLHKDRSPSPAADEVTDKSRSSSITSEKPDDKTTLDRHSRSPSPSKLDEKDMPEDKLTKDKSPSLPIDGVTVPSRTPSIIPEKLDEHDVPIAQLPKDKSPSPTPNVALERSRASSIVSDKPEEIDTSDIKVQKDGSPSPSADKATEKPDGKTTGHEAPKDRSPSPVAYTVTEKTETLDITHEKLDTAIVQTGKSPKDQSPTSEPEETSVVGGKTDEKSRSPSIVSEKLDDKHVPSLDHPKDKSPSPSTDKLGTPDHKPEEKVPSSVGGKLDEKPQVLGDTDTPRDTTDKETSPSPISEASDKIRSPSLSSEEPEEKAPTPIGEKVEDKKPDEKSEKDRSPSPGIVETDKTEVKELTEKPKSLIATDTKPAQPEVVAKDSVDKIDTTEKSKFPLDDAPKKEVTDVSKSPDLDKDEAAEVTDKGIAEAKSPVDVSKPVITTGKPDDIIPVGQKTDESPKSPSPLGEKPEKHSEIMSSVDKPKTLDISSTEVADEPKDKSRSSSVMSDRSKSPSVIDEKDDDLRPYSRASAKSEPEEQADSLKSFVPSHELGEKKDIHKSLSDGSLPEEPKSPGAVSDKFDIRDTADSKSPRDRSPSYDRTPKDRSRSHSLFDTGDKTPLGRSRAASLFDDKLDDKIALLDFDGHSMRPSISEEVEDDKLPVKDEDSKSGTKSPSVGDRESPVSKEDEIPASKRLEIEQYIIDEFITKKRKITSQIIEEIVIKKSVSRYIIIEIIEEIIIKLKIRRESVIDVADIDEPKDDYTDVKDKHSIPETPEDKPALAKEIKPEESVLDSKRSSITGKTSPVHDVQDENKPRGSVTVEVCDLKITESRKSSTGDDLLVEPVPHAIKKRSIGDEFLEPKTNEPEKVEPGKDDSPKPGGIDDRRHSIVDDKHSQPEATEIEPVKIPEAEAPKKPCISGEKLPEFDSPKETVVETKKPEDQATPDAKVIPTVVAKTEEGREIQPEGFEEEVVTVTDAKRTEIEEYIVEEYIKKGRKITREIVEEIVIRKAVPRYIILEIIEEIIIKRKISRVSVIDFVEEEVTDKEDARSTTSSISDKDDAKLRKLSEDRFDITGKSTPEISSAKDQTIDFSGKSTPDLKSSLLSEKYSDKSGYSTPDMKQFDERSGKSTPDYRTEYESQFHKAFVGGMTEMRTTHITTLSGKSTPDFGAGREDTPEPKSESQSKPDAPAEKPDAEVHESDSIPAKHEVDAVPIEKAPGKPSEVPTTSQSIFASTISGITKATSELVTKFSESTASSVSTVTSKILTSHPEPKTTDQSGPEESTPPSTVEKTKTPESVSEPEIIAKVIKQEGDSREPSETEVITTTIKHVTEPEVITKVVKPEFEAQQPSDVATITKTVKHVTEIEESEPEIITKVIKRESLPTEDGTTISSTLTTVTKRFEVESEPEEEEVITRVIRREIETSGPSETEVITRTVRHVTEIEEGDPEIITKVIRQEVSEPADDDSDSERFTKIIRCGIEKHEPQETETITRTVRQVTEVEEGEPQIIRKVVRREVVDGVEDETSTTTYTTVRTSETDSEPEVITKTIRRVVEMEDPSETEVITRTVRHVTEVEEGEPHIVKKVVRREVVDGVEDESSTTTYTTVKTSETDSEPEVITRKIRRVVEIEDPSETEVITRTVRHVTEVEGEEPQIVRKVTRREVVDGVEGETSTTTYTTVKTTESDSEPEVVTRTIRRVVETEDPSETEVITRTVRHVTEVEEGEPEIITKVTRREIFVSDDEEDSITTTKTSRVTEYGDSETSETSETVTKTVKSSEGHPEVVKRIISREGAPELTETVTTRTTRTIVSEAGHPTETTTRTTTTTSNSDIEKPELITRIISREGTPEISETIKRTTKTISSDAGPEYVTRIISREGTPDIVKTSEVKRIVTTVTTVTGPDGESVTTKDVKESNDKLDDEDLLEKLIDSSSSEKSQKSGPDVETSEERFVSETPDGLVTEEIMKRTVTTVTSTSGISTPDVKTFIDSGKSTPDHKEEEKIVKHDKPTPEPSKDSETAAEMPTSHLLKDLVTEDKTYSGKSTPDISASPVIKGSATISGRILSGRSTPDRKSEGRSRTATPEGFRSGEVIRTIITTTRTMSDDGEIITTTKEVTESTDDQGQTTILEEKTDVKRDDKLPGRDAAETAISSVIGHIRASELKRGSSPGSDVMSDKDFGPMSPRSDISSGHSRAATHVWGSSEERHTYSDDDPPSSPLSATSQFGYSPQLPRYELPFDKDARKSGEAPGSMMTGSFYGELPSEATTMSSAKAAFMSAGTTSKNSEPIPIKGEHSTKRFTVEKEFAGGYDYRSETKKYVDDGDLDFDRAMMEHREKRGEDLVSHHYSNGSSSVVYTNGNSREKSMTTTTVEKTSSLSDKKKQDPMAASFSAEKQPEEGEKSGKDPLEGWGKPLFLPSPKPPRKFNLQRPVASTSSEELNPESLNFDVINNWGEPLRLPSPAPAPAPTNEVSNKGAPGTPKKERKQPKKVVSENNKNKKQSESPSKNDKKSKDSKNKVQPVYMDLTYVPHHGNSYYSSLEFFKRIRARYYVFSGTEPSREVYDALLEAKKTWEDKNLEVTMIPTYDTDTLGYWVADNEEALAANHIDLSPSASRCTINLQDHETSCSAYRLEF